MADTSLGLQRWSRRLLALSGVVLVFSGLSFFLLPDYAVENFPWNVSPLVAMTIGGWALGMGMMALESVRAWFLPRVQAALIALWSFCVFELIVVAAFLPVLRTDHWMTWPYLIALGLGAGSAALGLPALWLQRAEVIAGDDDVPAWLRLTFAAFAALVAVLGVSTLLVTPVTGTVFPEALSPFTTRAFSAFFFALSLGALPLLVARRVEPAVWYSRHGLYLIVLIVVAAFSYLHLFDFVARPGGLIYIGAYVVTAVVAAAIVLWDRRYTSTPWRH